MGQSNTTETWLPIPGFNGYEVSDFGRVRAMFAFRNHKEIGRILKPTPITREGDYPVVTLAIGQKGHRKSKRMNVHHLVLIAFVGPRPKGQEGLHRDDNRLNNALTNLRWGTHVENTKDAIQNGKVPVGTKNGQCKLTEEQVLEIREAVRDGKMTQADAMRKFKMSRQQISAIITRRKWKHL